MYSTNFEAIYETIKSEKEKVLLLFLLKQKVAAKS
jgi:hypothetical protein